jgi:sec-independent protein translocase protein TatB
MDICGIGAPELVVILIVALVVLGPERLPDVARTIGRTVYEFRKVTGEATSVFREVIDTAQFETRPSNPPEPRQPNGQPFPMDNTGIHPMFRRDQTGMLPPDLVPAAPPAPGGTETATEAVAFAPPGAAAAAPSAFWYPEPGDPNTPAVKKPTDPGTTLDYPAPFSE